MLLCCRKGASLMCSCIWLPNIHALQVSVLTTGGLYLQETDNPDLRDRAYVYWRLLSSDPEAARSVVLAEKPVIAQDTSSMDPKLLQTLLGNLSTLSSVYHLPPSVGPLAFKALFSP